jgi:diacylglycerol kinase (ATP)
MSINFSFRKLLLSFKYAGRGLVVLFKSQQNALIHLLALVFVFALAWYLQLSKIEWLFIVLSVTMVIVAEAFNTAIEFLADSISKEHHPLIGKAKDVGAGAVLLTAIMAVVVGILVFGPHLLA